MKTTLLKLPIILCVALFWANAANSQIFFTEGFEGALDPLTDLPATWTESGLSIDGFYEVGDEVLANSAGYWPVPAHTLFAQSNDDACNCDKSEDRLILPVQDFSTFTGGVELIADFYMDGNYGSTGFIEVSTDGGATWTVIHTMALNPAAWQDNSTHDLSAYVGLANVSIAFRYNDQASWATGLAVDNVRLNEFALASFDVSMTGGLDQSAEYTQVPLTQVIALGTSGVIDNIGASPVTNATMTVNVYDGLMSSVYMASSTPVGIAAGANATATVPGYTPSIADVYTVEYVATITETDAVITNDTTIYTIAVTDTVYARDNGIQTGTLGIGAGNGGTLGQHFDIVNADDITSVTFRIGNSGGSMTNQTVTMQVWDMVAGVPNAIVATTVPLVILDAVDSTYNASLATGPYAVAAGTQYMIAIQEVDSNTLIATTNSIATPLTTWVTWPTSPILPWAANEDFGFVNTYIIRPIFGSTTGCTNSAASVTETSCGDFTAPSGAILTSSGVYTDVIPNACGADSTITITLTIAVLDLTVTGAGGVMTAGATAPSTYQWYDCTAGAVIAGETGQTFTPTVTGDYAVIITDGACSDTSTCMAVTVGGLTDIAANGGVEVYPNPSNGTFNVSVNGITTNAMSIEVLDMTGRIIETRTFDNVQGQLTTSIELDVQEGAYLVRISANGETAVQSVVISKK
ncbi:MAG: hypothetical protein ACI865_000305 [Flavobacteriaceae bacterium]|jgi:hypothetical protein